MKKFIPYGRQSIDETDIAAVVRTLKSDRITQGPAVLQFERALAKASGTKYAVAVTSGTAALHLSYLAAGFGEGDEVITTPNTFAGTSNMLLAVGAKPVFCDIRLDTYNIDESKIEKLITKKTKAIVPVHFAGHPCDMQKVMRIAKKHGLLVIEDAAHALGATFKGKKMSGFGNMGILSFHPVKTITTGEGGAVVCNSKLLYEKLMLLRSHGIVKEAPLGKNVMKELGFNWRLPDILATLGLSQMRKFKTFIQKRRKVVSWYQELFKKAHIPEIILPQEMKGNRSAWHIYVIRTQKKKDRDLLARFMLDKGVGVNFHYPAIYTHPYWRQHGYKNVHLKNADLYTDTCLVLPCFPGLSRKDVQRVVHDIQEYFTKA